MSIREVRNDYEVEQEEFVTLLEEVAGEEECPEQELLDDFNSGE